MLFAAKEDLATHLKGSVSLTNGHVELVDAEKFQKNAYPGCFHWIAETSSKKRGSQ